LTGTLLYAGGNEMFKTKEELATILKDGHPVFIEEIPENFLGPRTEELLERLDASHYMVYSVLVESFVEHKRGTWYSLLHNSLYRSLEGQIEDDEAFNAVISDILDAIYPRAQEYQDYFESIASLITSPDGMLVVEIYDEMSFESRTVVWYRLED
jgi:hypothetical protein